MLLLLLLLLFLEAIIVCRRFWRSSLRSSSSGEATATGSFASSPFAVGEEVEAGAESIFSSSVVLFFGVGDFVGVFVSASAAIAFIFAFNNFASSARRASLCLIDSATTSANSFNSRPIMSESNLPAKPCKHSRNASQSALTCLSMVPPTDFLSSQTVLKEEANLASNSKATDAEDVVLIVLFKHATDDFGKRSEFFH